MGNGAVAPYIIILAVPVVGNVYPIRFGVRGRVHDVPLRDLLGDLRQTAPSVAGNSLSVDVR